MKPIPAYIRERVLDMVRREGESSTLRQLKISRMGLYRGLSGLGVQDGTHAQFERAMFAH